LCVLSRAKTALEAMTRLIFVLACVAVFAHSASAVVAPNQASYLWNGLYNQTSGELVAGFGSFNQYCQQQAVGYVSYFCNETVRVQYNCNSSNCTDCVEVVNANPEFVGAQTVNTTGGATATFNLTTFCSIDKDAFARNLTSLTRDITLAVYSRVADCSGAADYYVAAPVGTCVAIEQYQSPFSIDAGGVTVYYSNNTNCSTTVDPIVAQTPYNATAESCVSASSPSRSTLRLGFQTAITTTGIQTTGVQTTGVQTTDVQTTDVQTTAIPTTTASTTGIQTTAVIVTTGIQTTGVQTTGVQTTAVIVTTGVQTTAVIPTTGIQTTGVQTTGVQTTGVQTTGVQTTGRSTSSASTLSIASMFVVAAIAVALF